MIIETRNKSCEIEFIINSETGSKLVAYDSEKPNTVYFSRDLSNEINKYIIKLPISPKILTINLDSIESYKISQLKTKKLIVNKETIRFINFAKKFAVKAGYLKTGLYSDIDNQFVIDYQFVLKKRNVEANTPARIGVTNNVIQISKKKFRGMSIPDRFLILLHEYSHNYINKDPDSELEADKWAELIYFSLGFPVFNGIDILYKILGDDKLSEKRIKQVYYNASNFAETRKFSNFII